MSKPAFPSVYNSPETLRGPFVQTAVPEVPFKTDDHKATTVYDVAGTDIGHANPGAPEYPHAPNLWKHGRDPYANGGMDSEVNPV